MFARPSTSLLAAGVIAATLVVAAPAQQPTPAQQPAPPPQPTFRIEANYIRVDAYPTTKNGAPAGDLTRADFEILEGGVAQRIEQFEHVVIHATATDLRVDPNTIAESSAQLETTRGRVFVIFLDIGHVTISGSHRMREPLTEALDRMIGPDDLVAVMTPEMSPRDLAFARKATTIAGFLARHWNWGEAPDGVNFPLLDPVEQMYEACYGPVSPPPPSPVTAVMIMRRREQRTVAALSDLVAWLRGVREERKAIVFVSNGMAVVGPAPALLTDPDGRQTPPAIPQVGVDPKTGKLTTLGTPASKVPSYAQCEHDRALLAQLDNRPAFRAVLDQANASNASFYPISPSGLWGLTVTGAGRPVAPYRTLDQPMFSDSTESLRALADNTDGLAIVQTNDLASGMRRIVDDLSSYYLLGYYSTGKLDGKFHAITVRVKRPGVSVRARRGYLAATPNAATANRTSGASKAAGSGRASSDPAAAERAAEAHAIDAAVGPLDAYTHDVPLRLQFASGWKPADTSSAALWVVGEIGAAALAGEAWSEGFEATATLATPEELTVANGRTIVPRSARTFRMAVTPSMPLAAGEYVLRVSARPMAAGSIPSRETVRLTVGATPAASGALYVRRGPATGNKDAPTADLRFRRNEQLRVEVPGDAADGVSARLLDRTGKALNVPVTAAVRDEGDGSRWHTAQLALAPLAPGDYVIEITRAGGPGRAGGAGGESRALAAFRVIQ